ncbi:CubicO group peptidase (beta-lactamase class C family) [Spirosoma oryzae]|uniref:CubicO group peptidase (Beta-lactamase class C family) n=1 Tax=Spirosoma oryzae TaxID=1469603 RepID=A0A2T0RQ01_9BACT|nr:serine hydrolase domain-containing protein [Spirosoma oryzae]PRY23266.1 CubicO group peptidase (beta-lactamase class C family) [Spirosoma oryzae]
MRQTRRLWSWVLSLVVAGLVGACGSSTEKQIAKSAKDLKSCADEQKLSPEQQQAVRKQIDADHKSTEIEAIIRQKVREGFNGNVLIAQKGIVLYKNCFGLGHFERGERDTLVEDSKFQLASLSKTFTAVGTLKLIEMGKLSLDDSIQKFYPDFPYHGISVRELLSHRSGLPNYAYAFDDSMKVNFYKREKPYPTNATIMHWFATVKPTPQRYNIPGRGFSYSNTNYMVLASIIEKVTKQSYESYINKTILEPLGMRETFVATSRNEAFNKHKTAGYQWNRRIPKDYYDDVVGDKGIYSTIGDLFRWYRALNGNCILQKKTMAEAFIPRSFERKGAKNYGYGFRMMLDAKDQPEFIYHSGWWKGYNTMFWFSPKDEYVIIMLGNKYNKTVYRVKELIEALHGKEVAPTTGQDTEVEI